MIRFFRHFRMRMLSQNRFTRYLIYAVGEIILVMIGILLALQVNNWNTDRANRKLEAKYLRSLKADLEADLIGIEQFKLERHVKYTSGIELLEFHTPETGRELRTFDSLTWRLFVWREYNPNTNTSDELISTGNLSLISNDSIRNGLLNVLQANKEIANLLHHTRREYEQYLYDKLIPNRELLPDRDFRQYIATRRKDLPLELSAERVVELALQSEVLMKDITFRNGIKLAINNNFWCEEYATEQEVKIAQLIALIDEELAEKA